MTRNLLSKAVLSFAVAGIVPVSAMAADTYNVDPLHSSAVFKIKHLDSTYVHGRFNDIKGKVVFDEANPAKSSVQIEIDANSIDTNVKQRDDHLRSPDFFSVKEFPKLSFKSTAVQKVNDTLYRVTGDFNLHGITKPITVNFVKMSAGKKGMQGEIRGGGETSFKINRSDFGMNFMQGALGDEVFITLAVEGIRQ